jgi:hypothetical protein
MRRSLSTAAVGLALAVLVGCSGPGSDSGGAASSAGGGAGAKPAVADNAADRQVVTTATASLAVKDPAAGAERVSQLAESAGGRVDERSEQAAAGGNGVEGAAADLVVRVPAAALTGVLADLEKLGDVVTGKAVDMDARISALQTSVARLQALMDGAATTEALLTAEKALAERQGQLESLQSQRALLTDQVELSTLNVHLRPFGVAPAGGPDGFRDGLGTGWRALVSTLGAGVIVLGVLLPWMGLAALVAVAVLVPLRRMRRRTALPATAPPQA